MITIQSWYNLNNVLEIVCFHNAASSISNQVILETCSFANPPAQVKDVFFSSQMEQHSKALKILVYKLKDFAEAERFCELYSRVCLWLFFLSYFILSTALQAIGSQRGFFLTREKNKADSSNC